MGKKLERYRLEIKWAGVEITPVTVAGNHTCVKRALSGGSNIIMLLAVHRGPKNVCNNEAKQLGNRGILRLDNC